MKTTHKQHLKHNSIVTVVLVLIIGVIACRISTGNQDQTTANLDETSAAFERNGADSDVLFDTETVPVEQQQPMTPTLTAIPTSDNSETPSKITPPIPLLDFSYEGISFSYDKAHLSGITARVIEGQNKGEDMLPDMTYPTHIQFDFDHYPVTPHIYTPVIRVYPVVAYENISEIAASTVTNLKKALLEQPDGGMFVSLPSMPLWGAPTLFTTQVQYLDFQNGSGMRFLAMFAQDLLYPDNQNLIYIYQGITHDGQYYVSAILPMTHPGLPDDGQAEITNWDHFYANWDDLCTDTLKLLEEAGSHNFSPSLDSLDIMLASMTIQP